MTRTDLTSDEDLPYRDGSWKPSHPMIGRNMMFAVYDTGMNYLIAELRNGNPVRGLLVDKAGSLAEDERAFATGEPRLGSVKMKMMATVRLAASSKYLATCNGTDVASYSGVALDDREWWRYAGVEPEG